VLDSLFQRVCAEKGFAPASEVDLPAGVALPGFEFLGVRSYWGSVMSLGLVRGDRRSLESLVAVTDELYRFTSALRPLAGSVNGAGLGSFGLLLLVFSEGCSPEQRAGVRTLKRGSAWRKDYLVSWACDLPAGRIHRHRGFPLSMFPGRRYVETTIRGISA